MRKFKINDIVKNPREDGYFKIRGIYDECYDAADCDKNGNLEGGSIDIWFDSSYASEGYAVEANFEKVPLKLTLKKVSRI